MIVFRPATPESAPWFSLELHPSLEQGLVAALGGPIEQATSEQLTAWADDCDNPTGQRAALARALAALRILGDGLARHEPGRAAVGFWDAASR